MPDDQVKDRMYFRPYLFPKKPGKAWQFADTSLYFDQMEIIEWLPNQNIRRQTVDIADCLQDPRQKDLALPLQGQLQQLALPRYFAGLDCSNPLLMGILNITPDSFYDGGRYNNYQAAVDHAVSLKQAGADILDVGGESTRPGATPVEPALEMERVIPVVQELANRGILVSIDTRHHQVMESAISHGAKIVNDVSALTFEARSIDVMCRHPEISVILMHMQGQPATMQQQPFYSHVTLEVFDYLKKRLEKCLQAGISKDRLSIDPGIGFGKTLVHDIQLFQELSLFHGLGVPIVLGGSRKKMIGKLSLDAPVEKRLGGSIAISLQALNQGVQILRIHDVAETCQAYKVWQAVTVNSGNHMLDR